ncbi:LacI family transcriptional regulator [Pararhizobium sp. BT-229]|uniref:LacI family DNA-binding transcriptional regulator n=1 Tax=Pararhizobium sp. BT-229 TaxID=2986923 RepID=UPI0021F7A097|nr:LacI family DNA-binding transcriptional regulator [Pararhizobium sp. BT-229]MCV9966711.1 LacI family transcriptional regulator [Pararhizobium sp. BT-229]
MSNNAGNNGRTTNERPARLIDVARRAKVSRATAARALGGYGLVGDDTRERVMAAARELNYSANVVARAMRAGTTQTIGVVVADISNSFFSYAIRAIIDTATLAGYQTLVLNTDDNINKEIDAVRVLLE